MSLIIHRYIFFELLPPFLINMVFFTFLFLMTKILEITNLIVNYRIGLLTVLSMLVYSMPFFLQFIIPMSVMMSVLLTFLRLSTDNEIVALKSGGISIYRLLPPVFLFCLVGYLMTSFMGIYGLPKGRLALKELAVRVIASNLDIGLKERTFNDQLEGVILYVNKVDLKSKTLVDVFIQDQRNEKVVSTVVAPKARLMSDPEKFTFYFRLYNGTINQVDLDHRSAHMIHFDTYDLTISPPKPPIGTPGGPKDEEEMSIPELQQYVRQAEKKDDRYYLALMELHKKFSIPAACFALGLLAFPLGIQSKSAKTTFGIGLGLFFFLLYYIMLSAGWVFGEAGVYPPAIGMWVPNVVTAGFGMVILVRTARERTVRLDALMAIYARLKSSFTKPENQRSEVGGQRSENEKT
ncbi:MAG: LPS export ABC transporter permease LptF [Desulfobacteraceae bacterium]|nr:MAG: LPS export ABC transporter permease LptF [Desulfobacteraceae bacterium]